jgi:hypothetical protein
MRILPDGRLEGIYRIASGSGLVLAEIPEQASNRRVRTLHFQAAEKWKRWRAARTKQTIHLI